MIGMISTHIVYSVCFPGLVILLGCWADVCIAQLSTKPTVDSGNQVEIVGYETTFPALGTLVTLKAFDADPSKIARAFAQAERRVHALEAILTDYDPQSETRRLSELAIERPVRVSDELWQVLVAADEWNQRTPAFDCSLGALTRLWRKYRRVDRLPSESQVQQALEQSGWRYVELAPQAQTVQLRRNGLQLDFGAIGKGYIVDQAYDVLLEEELPCCLVNISGNMRAGLAPPGRVGWRIEVAPLEKGGEALRQVTIADQSIATSGDLWQFVIVDGQRRSHILDPKTGYGVLGPVSATVIADTATNADALATVACVIGFDKTAEIARDIPGTELLLAERLPGEPEANSAPKVYTTAGFPN
jgi:thiamine biosynthesis lipoprotein